MQELADLKVKAAKKGGAIKNMDIMNNQLRSELEQLEHYNQFLANECPKKILSLIDKRVLLETKKPKLRPRRNVYPGSGTKHYEPAFNAIRDLFLKKVLLQKIRSRNATTK